MFILWLLLFMNFKYLRLSACYLWSDVIYVILTRSRPTCWRCTWNDIYKSGDWLCQMWKMLHLLQIYSLGTMSSAQGNALSEMRELAIGSGGLHAPEVPLLSQVCRTPPINTHKEPLYLLPSYGPYFHALLFNHFQGTQEVDFQYKTVFQPH